MDMMFPSNCLLIIAFVPIDWCCWQLFERSFLQPWEEVGNQSECWDYVAVGWSVITGKCTSSPISLRVRKCCRREGRKMGRRAVPQYLPGVTQPWLSTGRDNNIPGLDLICPRHRLSIVCLQKPSEPAWLHTFANTVLVSHCFIASIFYSPL